LKQRKLSANPLELLKVASRIGVDLIGCGAWARLLGVTDKLPSEIRIENPAECLMNALEAKKIITIA